MFVINITYFILVLAVCINKSVNCNLSGKNISVTGESIYVKQQFKKIYLQSAKLEIEFSNNFTYLTNENNFTNQTKESKETKERSLNENFSFNLGLYNEIYFFRALTKLKLKSQFLNYFNSLSDFEIFLENEENLSREVIMLIDNIDLLRNIQSMFYMSQGSMKNIPIKNTGYIAIIYNNSTNPLNLVVQDLTHPIFEIEEEQFNIIKKYSKLIGQGVELNTVTISYDNTEILLPFNYVNLSSFILISILILSLLIWNINNYIFNKQHTSAIQYFLTGLIYMKIIIISLIYFYVKLISVYNLTYENEDVFTKVYLETALVILGSIYRTMFYFFLLLLSHGWKIYVTKLSGTDVRNFVIIYLIIYITICFDQVLDLIFKKWGIFNPSEIKNMITCVIFNVFIIKKVYLSVNFLKTKLVYAFENSPQFVESLRFKISLMMKLLLISIMHMISFIIYNIIYRVNFFKYEIFDGIITLINFNNFDTILFLLILVIFRSKKLPEHFYTGIGNIDDTLKGLKLKKIQVYRTKISNDYFLSEIQIEHFKKNSKTLLLIQNPYHSETDHLNDVCIGFPHKV